MPRNSLSVRGPAPFEKNGVYEITIHIVATEPKAEEIEERTFSYLWREDFHLRVEDGVFFETLGNKQNPLPKYLFDLGRIWILAVDQNPSRARVAVPHRRIRAPYTRQNPLPRYEGSQKLA